MTVQCSRCEKRMEAFTDGGMTCGYYLAAAAPWKKYANVGDVVICDRCMWNDPLYIDDYGVTPPGATGRA
jgi:hypothetical protein